jgi:hypothetical protein
MALSTAWEIVLLYTNDILAASETGERIIHDEIRKYFKLKPDSIQRPTQYLGGKLRQVPLESGVNAWAYSLLQLSKPRSQMLRSISMHGI